MNHLSDGFMWYVIGFIFFFVLITYITKNPKFNNKTEDELYVMVLASAALWPLLIVGYIFYIVFNTIRGD